MASGGLAKGEVNGVYQSLFVAGYIYHLANNDVCTCGFNACKADRGISRRAIYWNCAFRNFHDLFILSFKCHPGNRGDKRRVKQEIGDNRCGLAGYSYACVEYGDYFAHSPYTYIGQPYNAKDWLNEQY